MRRCRRRCQIVWSPLLMIGGIQEMAICGLGIEPSMRWQRHSGVWHRGTVYERDKENNATSGDSNKYIFSMIFINNNTFQVSIEFLSKIFLYDFEKDFLITLLTEGRWDRAADIRSRNRMFVITLRRVRIFLSALSTFGVNDVFDGKGRVELVGWLSGGHFC